MTLQEIFNRINANYNTVTSLSNSIYTPYMVAIDTHWGKARIYADRIVKGGYQTWHDVAYATEDFAFEIVWLLEVFIDEIFSTTFSIKGTLQTIFNTYMAYVVNDVINSVQFVQTEMYKEVDFLAAGVDASILGMENYLNKEVDFLAASVDASILGMEDYLDSEVNAMHAEIDLLSIDVISWIDAAVANLADTLNARIEEVNINLTARVNFLETWTQIIVQAVYEYVDFLNAEMLAYINEANSTLYFYINNRVKELNEEILSVQNTLNARITIEVNILSDEIAIVEISLTDKINELINTTGWNFTFFDLFTFTPELSLLRVLLRSETEFKQYKPYWQALFAKVLAED